MKQSIANMKRNDYPWTHFIFEGGLEEDQINDILKADISREAYIFDGTRSGNKKGEGNLNTDIREYITKENINKYSSMNRIIETMRDKNFRRTIQAKLRLSQDFANSYIRLEILKDVDGFWLETHCDIPEKLISCLIYVNPDNHDINLGTDLYKTKEQEFPSLTLPYIHNLGYMFHGPNTWHGFRKGKKIPSSGRRGLQLNYVTFPTDFPV